jgi:hypothetical protein
MNKAQSPLAADLLHGAVEIAEYTGSRCAACNI